jgi:RNA polymerase sigma-70 factor (ECF subfamily)
MLLNAARIPTRVDGDGQLLRLQEQDRARWDRTMVARGMFHFAQSAAGGSQPPADLAAFFVPRDVRKR